MDDQELEDDDTPPMEPVVTERLALFHRHLDDCGRCRYEPFNLCPIGAMLIKVAASGG